MLAQAFNSQTFKVELHVYFRVTLFQLVFVMGYVMV